ncbi:MAG: FAD-dependent oxidoreductase, partial [Pseudomonadota bacterium]
NNEHVRLVKGSHIITKSLFPGEQAYFFQNEDGRIIFAIPYEEGRFTLIGTTDEIFNADPQNVKISNEEIQYLCESANAYFDQKINGDDVIATYSGVRPLYDDKASDDSAVTRDYVLSTKSIGGAPIVSVYGGKITTYRKLAEDVLDELMDTLHEDVGTWTKDNPLPGGDILDADFESYAKAQSDTLGWLDPEVRRRLLRAYGTRAHDLLGDSKSTTDLGHHYGSGLYQAEVDYLVDREFARTAEDILRRRTKLYLHMSAENQARLKESLETGTVA